jgi:multimeric flavodoxin WrbA
MNKRVLIVAGSPRKDGNSDLLCGELSRGAKDSGNQVETVFLREKRIGYCVACEACVNNGGSCVQKDDMAEILAKMVTSEVIVLATPVYFYAMSGQMKTFIDRNIPRYREMLDKSVYFIITAADTDKAAIDRTVEEFRGYLSCLTGAKEKGIICGTGAWAKGDIRESQAMREAYEAGKGIR